MAKKQAPKEHSGLTKAQKARIINGIGTAVVFVVGVLVLYAAIIGHARPPRRGHGVSDEDMAPRPTAECPSRHGDAWEYDSDTRCYFDPSAGSKGQWKPGRPPDNAERARRMAGRH